MLKGGLQLLFPLPDYSGHETPPAESGQIVKERVARSSLRDIGTLPDSWPAYNPYPLYFVGNR